MGSVLVLVLCDVLGGGILRVLSIFYDFICYGLYGLVRFLNYFIRFYYVFSLGDHVI